MILFSSIVINKKVIFILFLCRCFSLFSLSFLLCFFLLIFDEHASVYRTTSIPKISRFQRYSMAMFSSSRRINSCLPKAWWPNATTDWVRSQGLYVQCLRNKVESVRFRIFSPTKVSFLFFSFLFFFVDQIHTSPIFFPTTHCKYHFSL